MTKGPLQVYVNDPEMGVSLNRPGGPDVIKRVLLRGRQGLHVTKGAKSEGVEAGDGKGTGSP